MKFPSKQIMISFQFYSQKLLPKGTCYNAKTFSVFGWNYGCYCLDLYLVQFFHHWCWTLCCEYTNIYIFLKNWRNASIAGVSNEIKWTKWLNGKNKLFGMLCLDSKSLISKHLNSSLYNFLWMYLFFWESSNLFDGVSVSSKNIYI